MELVGKIIDKLKTVGVAGTLKAIYQKLGDINEVLVFKLDKGKKMLRTKIANDELLKQMLRKKRKAALHQYFAEGGNIRFRYADNPKLTVLIVLCNQAELTLACLEALRAQDEGLWEILIIDNASSDETHNLLNTIDGVRIIYNQENIGFLQAVNLGAAQARGEYLLLLNNDAVVHEGSILQAIKTIESAPDIGAVGGRVILPNGLLQEAGSIIWRAGDCVGYARNQHPEENCVMFMRDVDYCSGVFLLTKTQLFKDMGGFDLRYLPAYYEESDYCIRLWKRGFRVVYNPFIALDHYEFGSSLSNEAEQLMKINQLKLIEAHNDFLSNNYEMNKKNILVARMRNKYKGRILLIDDRVPMNKLGTGYPRANLIVNMLVQEQWFVTLYSLQHIIDDWQEVYENIPAAVEVILNSGIEKLEQFLIERENYYDVMFISRPVNMRIVKDLYDKNSNIFGKAKIIYDAEALWAAREIMKKELCGIYLSQQEKKRLIAEEVNLVGCSDCVLAVNQNEANYFIKNGHKNVYLLGHALEVNKTPNEFDDRADILFVGNMAADGSPNVNSVLWFVNEILPIINSRLAENVKLYLIGKTGAGDLQNIVSEQVVVLGTVDDLYDWYNKCRIFIAPTRFAAGIPLKVLEASAYGIPSVVTSTLAKQLSWQHEQDILVGQTAQDFAEQCIRLYSDKALWETIRENVLKRIVRENNTRQFREVLANLLDKEQQIL